MANIATEPNIPEASEMASNFNVHASQPNAQDKSFNQQDDEMKSEQQVAEQKERPQEYVYVTKKVLPKPVPLPMKVQTINEQVDIRKAKRKKGISHKKRKHLKKPKYQRQATADDAIGERKILDGFLLLHSCRVKNPQQAVKSKLVGENIVEVEEGDLLFFQNLTYLNLSENRIRLEQLVNLKALRELYIQYNFIKGLQVEPGSFTFLEVLSLGFNSVPAGHILQLAQLPSLRSLDLSGNELCILPEDLSAFGKLEDLNLSSNNFSSDSVVVEPGKQFKSLSTIPHLKRLNLSHNALKGIYLLK